MEARLDAMMMPDTDELKPECLNFSSQMLEEVNVPVEEMDLYVSNYIDRSRQKDPQAGFKEVLQKNKLLDGIQDIRFFVILTKNAFSYRKNTRIYPVNLKENSGCY